jgi:hypothetical protein
MSFARQARLAAMATLGLAMLYLAIFALAGSNDWPGALRAALCNALPAIGLGWLVAARIAPLLWPVRGWAVALGVAATLIGYALISYALTLMLLAITGGDTGSGGLWIRYFTGPAFIWQSFQGLAYGLIAFLIGWLAEAQHAASAASPPGADPLGRLLIRTDRGIVPVDGSDVIRIVAADDYCELILPGARHLARMSMAQCEMLLASEPIVRVHRSHIISLRHLASAEPAGDGRLTLTMTNGDQLMTSRAGARLIRERSG